MTKAADGEAWGAFWAQEARRANRTGAADRGGCLPDGYAGIDAAQRAVWTQFARELPRRARVLDLATGDGRVARWIVAARADAKATGVDRAPALPSAPPGVKLRGGVAMEALPFPDASFDAVTAQFGFEYGDIELAAAEIARVLKPGGACALVTHRIDGPILAHNLRRREQIAWAIEEHDLPGLAKRSLALRGVGIVGVPPALEAAPREGAAKFGQGSAAWEIAEAIRRSLIMGARDTPANVAALIEQIAAQATNEIGRIASLEAACAVTANEPRLAAAFAATGLTVKRFEPLSENGGRPFADLRVLHGTE